MCTLENMAPFDVNCTWALYLPSAFPKAGSKQIIYTQNKTTNLGLVSGDEKIPFILCSTSFLLWSGLPPRLRALQSIRFCFNISIFYSSDMTGVDKQGERKEGRERRKEENGGGERVGSIFSKREKHSPRVCE